ncbi:hypothetical protein BGZ63DRAFT_118317 [Mariannaea sp. PMI_226]|nr:hypothetical protein BGZ63DRAFT_118317 [Mariannaea sp. PMI_226]
MAARMTPLSARLVSATTRVSSRASSTTFSQSFSRSLRQQRRPYSSQPGRNDTVKFWPFLAVIGLGTLGYMGLVNRRKD